jgi:hypothetical protein
MKKNRINIESFETTGNTDFPYDTYLSRYCEDIFKITIDMKRYLAIGDEQKVKDCINSLKEILKLDIH